MIANRYGNNPAKREGFIQKDKFVLKQGPEIYDDFYADIYDDLVYDSVKNNYEFGEILRLSKMEPKHSHVLDIGSGTGHHMKMLKNKGISARGLDQSIAMINKCKAKYPDLDIVKGDAVNAMIFPADTFTHINCLYFTVYYMKDKISFFQNCYKWLMPGGYLSLHLVNRDQFDPIVNSADPLTLVSPQKYAKKRITNSIVKFDDFQYKADFKMNKERNIAEFEEVFKDDATGNVRKNNHMLHMPTQKHILGLAKDAGFILQGKIDMVNCQYEYQYIYLLYKPE
jgi:SAM-dependent methyltransferase